MQALAKMNQTGLGRLLVVDGDRLVGVLALKDLLTFLALKVELEGSES
jgi:CBS domain-containing protein